jgi:hypothetical protein
VSNWISTLSTYGLPLTEISSRKLNEKEKNGQITQDLKEKIRFWKKSKGIDDQDDLEYKYFLEGVEALLCRPLEKEDLYVPLIQDLTLGNVVGLEIARKKIYYLSNLGCRLSGYWDSKQHDLYEAMLFWLIIRSNNFNPLVQRLISDPRLYQIGFQDGLIPSQDGISRALVRKWLQYFSLIKNKKLDETKLAVLLLYAVIFELNEAVKKQSPLKFYVEEWEQIVSEQFSISTSAICIGAILEWLYSKIDRQTMVGFPSGRGHKGLPSKPSIQILEINKEISLSIVGEVQPYEIRKVISFGGST